MYYTGWMSLTGLGSDCAFRCTSVNAAWLLDIWSISVSLSPILMATDICSLWAVDPRIKMATYEKLQCFWTCQSIYLERFAEHSQMQFTLFTYFQTSSKTLLFHFLLAHPARSRLLQLTRYINYFLPSLLTYISRHHRKYNISQCTTHAPLLLDTRTELDSNDIVLLCYFKVFAFYCYFSRFLSYFLLFVTNSSFFSSTTKIRL